MEKFKFKPGQLFIDPDLHQNDATVWEVVDLWSNWVKLNESNSNDSRPWVISHREVLMRGWIEAGMMVYAGDIRKGVMAE